MDNTVLWADHFSGAGSAVVGVLIFCVTDWKTGIDTQEGGPDARPGGSHHPRQPCPHYNSYITHFRVTRFQAITIEFSGVFSYVCPKRCRTFPVFSVETASHVCAQVTLAWPVMSGSHHAHTAAYYQPSI